MNILSNLLIAVQVLSALAMIGLILVQHGKGADMGAAFGSGASGSLFGASGSANFLSRSTAVIAIVFFVATLGLAYLGNNAHSTRSIGSVLEQGAPVKPQGQAVPATPGASAALAPAGVSSAVLGIPTQSGAGATGGGAAATPPAVQATPAAAPAPASTTSESGPSRALLQQSPVGGQMPQPVLAAQPQQGMMGTAGGAGANPAQSSPSTSSASTSPASSVRNGGHSAAHSAPAPGNKKHPHAKAQR